MLFKIWGFKQKDWVMKEKKSIKNIIITELKPTYIKGSVRDYTIVPFNSLFLFESVEEAIRQLWTQVKYPVNHFIRSRLLKGASVKAVPKGITTVISAVMLNKIQMSVEPMSI